VVIGPSQEQIIEPAPPQVSITSNLPQLESNRDISQQVPSIANNTTSLQPIIRGANIQDLQFKLLVLSNICGPIKEHIQFRECMSPEIRVITDINQWVMILLGLKGVIKSSIDIDYMQIADPPMDLKCSMESAYNNIDETSAAFINSMKQITNIIQSRLSKSEDVVSPSISILSAMNTKEIPKSRLP